MGIRVSQRDVREWNAQHARERAALENDMPTKKTGAKTAKRNTGKTETPRPPRSSRQVANAIWDRMKKNATFWPEVQGYIAALQGTDPARVAQVMPRETPATH